MILIFFNNDRIIILFAGMNESHVIIAAVVSGIGGTALTVFLVVLCYWCYRRKEAGNDEELVVKDAHKFQTYSTYSPGSVSAPEPPLKKPAEPKAPDKRTPMLSRKTIK